MALQNIQNTKSKIVTTRRGIPDRKSKSVKVMTRRSKVVSKKKI